jgi:hypothetical protein
MLLCGSLTAAAKSLLSSRSADTLTLAALASIIRQQDGSSNIQAGTSNGRTLLSGSSAHRSVAWPPLLYAPNTHTDRPCQGCHR